MKKGLFDNFSDKSIDIISALTSGILTDKLIDLFSTKVYSLSITSPETTPMSHNTIIQFIEENRSNLFFDILIIISSYFLFFSILKCAIPYILVLLRKIRFKPKKRYQREEIVEEFNQIKENIISIFLSISNDNNTHFNIYVLLFPKVFIEINKLYQIFCSSSSKNTATLKDCFRENSNNRCSIVGKYISIYDFRLLLQEVTKYIQIIKKSNLEKRLFSLNNKLEELGLLKGCNN